MVFIFISMLCVLLISASIDSNLITRQKLKLTYFDARGAAEVSRILLKIGGIEFEDHRLPIKKKPEGGFDIPEFTSMKSSGVYAVNMNRLPILHVDHAITIGQSRSIERYIAQQCNLMGKDDIERALVDCIAENVRDIKDKWGKVRMTGGLGKSTLKDAAIDKWFSGGELSEWLVKLEQSIASTGKQQDYAVGDALSLADVSIWHLLRDYFIGYDGEVRAAERKANCSKLSNIANKVGDLSVMKNWLLCRPAATF